MSLRSVRKIADESLSGLGSISSYQVKVHPKQSVENRKDEQNPEIENRIYLNLLKNYVHLDWGLALVLSTFLFSCSQFVFVFHVKKLQRNGQITEEYRARNIKKTGQKKWEEDEDMTVCINHCIFYIWSFQPIEPRFTSQIRNKKTKKEGDRKPQKTFTRAHQPKNIMTLMCLRLSCVGQLFSFSLSTQSRHSLTNKHCRQHRRFIRVIAAICFQKTQVN